MNSPLVSILIPNYNYGRYLKKCLDSAFSQSYKNIEVVLCDNGSTDNSMEIASSYIGSGLILNSRSFMSANFYHNVYEYCRGKYFVVLHSDDCIRPEFIEKAVVILEQHPNVGFLHGERDYIYENDNITELDFFFNQSFIATGKAMLPVLVMTGLGFSSQTIIRRDSFVNAHKYYTDMTWASIDMELWFRLSMVSDYAYMREKTCYYRVHAKSFNNTYMDTLESCTGMLVTLQSLFEWAEIRGYTEVLERKVEAYKKMTSRSYYHVHSAIVNNKFDTARKYINLIKLYDPDCYMDERLRIYETICDKGNYQKDIDVLPVDNAYAFVRRNYDPPQGFINLTY